MIFAERFGGDIVVPYARRTARLQTISTISAWPLAAGPASVSPGAF